MNSKKRLIQAFLACCIFLFTSNAQGSNWGIYDSGQASKPAPDNYSYQSFSQGSTISINEIGIESPVFVPFRSTSADWLEQSFYSGPSLLSSTSVLDPNAGDEPELGLGVMPVGQHMIIALLVLSTIYCFIKRKQLLSAKQSTP